MPLSRLSIACLASAAAAACLTFTSSDADASENLSFSAQRLEQQQDISPGVPDQHGCFDRIPISPVATMTTAGGTLFGPVMSTISIYSNGRIITSEASYGGASAAGTAFVDPASVENLAQTLRESGAFDLCDQKDDFYDVPLKTVTVFSGGQDAKAHTYSYYFAEDEYQQAEDAILGFLIENVLSR